MTITEKSWTEYINNLRKVNDTAADLMESFLDAHRNANGLWDDSITRQMVIDYAYSISTTYGEAAAELACEMYDAMGALSGLNLPAAVPAETANYGEVAKTVNGVMKYSANTELIGSSVGRLVKLTSLKTTMNNASRDGAKIAWIPHGDTCAFCIMLASAGWRNAAKDPSKYKYHAHGNCDCTFAIKFNDDTDYEGYDPYEYKKMYFEGGEEGYEDADNSHIKGKNPQWKQNLNGMRRKFYKENKEKINAQKRSAYAKRKELESSAAEEVNVE